MSIKIMVHVWNTSLLPNEKLVALALADHCHDDGSEGRPSVATICRKTGYSRSSVQRILQILVDKEILAVQRKPTPRSPTVYMFIMPDEGFPQGYQVTTSEVSDSVVRGVKLRPEPTKEPSYLTISKTTNKNDPWLIVESEIRRVGGVGSPTFNDPIIAKAVQDIGWRRLCKMTTYDSSMAVRTSVRELRLSNVQDNRTRGR